jgi:hypothetical protein
MRRLITLAVGAAALSVALTACAGSSEPARGFESGRFTVGKDVVAGTYVAQHPQDPASGYLCKWSVLSDTGNVLGSDATSKDGTHLAKRVLVLTDGLTVQSVGCGLWTLQQ